jgi:hypothetical protein
VLWLEALWAWLATLPDGIEQLPVALLACCGWLVRDYRDHPAALQRDLPHRTGTDFAAVASRLGWLSWEDCNEVLPGACPWLSAKPAAG